MLPKRGISLVNEPLNSLDQSYSQNREWCPLAISLVSRLGFLVGQSLVWIPQSFMSIIFSSLQTDLSTIVGLLRTIGVSEIWFEIVSAGVIS